MGNADGDIGGGVVYWLGQIDPITPSDVNGIGGPRLKTPIMLLYRALLGSALANIGAWASVVTSHSVAVLLELRIVGDVPRGEGFKP